MSEWNTYYRAFAGYKKGTAEDKKIRKLCEALAQSSSDGDFLESVRTYCIIEEDWIEIIETGIEHVEKAIREERQFIRKEGEVVPIEKLKRVSTETVRHLARHSELITKEPEEGEDLIPEKLYMAENLSDFAVYENRFLYMLLCYLRDFINVRLDKILELGRTYRFHTEIDKNVRIGKKHLKYKTSLYYEDKNDALADEFFRSSPLIERIETAQRLVIALLMTPLMKEVSKAPMLTPPITRTNVLRMNVHFKAALEMYSQLVAYTKPGYSIQELKNSYRPLPDAMMAEEAESIALNHFLSYKYGNKLSERLREEFEKEEQLRKEQEAQALHERIERLKVRIEQEGLSPYEYMLLLEEENRQREKDKIALSVMTKEVKNLNEKIEGLDKNIAELSEKNTALKQTVTEKENQIAEQAHAFEIEKRELQWACDKEKAELKEQCQKEKTEFKEQCQAEYKEFETNCMATAKEMELNLAQKQTELEQRVSDFESEKAENQKARILAQAQLHGLRQQYGLITEEEDFTSKERFLELEEEFRAFEQLFETQWKFTKKRIRKEILGKKRKATVLEIDDFNEENVAKQDVNEEPINEEFVNEEPVIEEVEAVDSVTQESANAEE